MLFATIIPMFFNLLFDYILMGPFKMGIQGGAIASLISFFITSIILIIFIIKSSSKISKFKNMFGFKHFR
jgi:Na+-driven multidrug efflux pump